MAEKEQKSKSNFVAPLTKIYREKMKKNKESTQSISSSISLGGASA